jgi:hypothetical protein
VPGAKIAFGRTKILTGGIGCIVVNKKKTAKGATTTKK